MKRLGEYFGVASGNKNEQVDLDFCPCTGYCEQGPNVVIDEEFIIHEASPGTITAKIENNEVVKIINPDFNDIASNDFLGDLL